MIKRTCLLVLPVVSLLVLSTPKNVIAHPGNTASDGCHYCRTNCDKWGEVWNERHCHGGGSTAPVITAPATTPQPTVKPIKVITPSPTAKPATPKPSPTLTPTPKPQLPTETPSPFPTPSETPQVLGLEDISPTVEPTIAPSPQPMTAGDTALGLGLMGVIFGVPAWAGLRIVRRFRKKILKDV